jgi:hypothetical protein
MECANACVLGSRHDGARFGINPAERFDPIVEVLLRAKGQSKEFVRVIAR